MTFRWKCFEILEVCQQNIFPIVFLLCVLWVLWQEDLVVKYEWEMDSINLNGL